MIKSFSLPFSGIVLYKVNANQKNSTEFQEHNIIENHSNYYKASG